MSYILFGLKTQDRKKHIIYSAGKVKAIKTKALHALLQIYSPKISWVTRGYFRGHQGQTLSGGEGGRQCFIKFIKFSLCDMIHGSSWFKIWLYCHCTLAVGKAEIWNLWSKFELVVQLLVFRKLQRSSCEREEINKRCNDRPSRVGNSFAFGQSEWYDAWCCVLYQDSTMWSLLCFHVWSKLALWTSTKNQPLNISKCSNHNTTPGLSWTFTFSTADDGQLWQQQLFIPLAKNLGCGQW